MKNPFHFFRKKSIEESTLSERPKEADQILEEQIVASLKEFNRSNMGLFTSAFTAGMEIGFSVVLMGTLLTLFAEMDPNTMHIYLSLCYPVGFIFVIIGRSELFTEHTALAILPVLRGSVSLKQLLTLWGLVYSGNLIGGFLFSFIISKIGPAVGFIEPSAFYYLAHEMVNHDWSTILLSALLAGWMMGLLGWLVTSSQETISRIFIIILVTTIIGVAGLHHCVVGSIEVFIGMITSPEINYMDYVKFQVWATAGNVIGGSVFVAILKYSHVRFD